MRFFVVYITFVAASVGCSGAADQSSSVRITTPDGEVLANKTTVDPVPQKVTLVTGDELKKLQALGTNGPEFVATYLSNIPEPQLKDYDRAFRAWQLSESPEHSDEEVINILGGYFGNKCIADFDMEWVSVSDEYGTDYAVRSKAIEVMSFPFSTISKRIEDKEYNFLHGVYYAVKHMIESDEYKRRDE